MTTNMDFTSSDLVLRLIDGSEAGRLYPVKTQKCLLGNNMNDSRKNSPHCTIIRGPQGTAIRSFGSSMIINGQQVESEWLQQGDQIQLGESRIEVYQLGHVSPQSVTGSIEHRQESPTDHEVKTYEAAKSCESPESKASNGPLSPVADQESRIIEANPQWSGEAANLEESTKTIGKQTSAAAFPCEDLESNLKQLPPIKPDPATSIANENHVRQTSPAESQFLAETSRESTSSAIGQDSLVRQFENPKDIATEFAQQEERFVGDAGCPSGCESEPPVRNVSKIASGFKLPSPNPLPEGEGTSAEAIFDLNPSGETVGQPTCESEVAADSNADENQTTLSAAELRAQEMEQLFRRLGADVSETDTVVEEEKIDAEVSPEMIEVGTYEEEEEEEEVFVTTSDEEFEHAESFQDQSTLEKLDTSEFEQNLGGQLMPLSEISEQIHFELGQQEESAPGNEAVSDPQLEQLSSVSNSSSEFGGAVANVENELSFQQQAWEENLEKAVGNSTTDLSLDSPEVAYSATDATVDSDVCLETTPETLPIEKSSEEQLRDIFSQPHEKPEEPIAVESVQPVVARSEEKNRSVAEILAQMQALGQLNDFVPPSDDESSTDYSEPQPMEPVRQTPVENSIADETSDNENSVEDYMNRLLGRMGNQEKQTQSNAQKTCEPETIVEPEAKPVNKVEPVVLLTASEYKPAKTAPEKNKNLDAMRELANQTNRAALKNSSKRRAKAIAITNFSIMVLGFCLSLFLLTNSVGMSDLFFWMGAATLGLSLGLGAIGVKTLLSLKE